MQHRIVDAPGSAVLELELEPGESVLARSGSVCRRSTGLVVRVRVDGGADLSPAARLWRLLVALARRALGRRSFLVNEIRAELAASVRLAPIAPGDVRRLSLRDGALRLRARSFLAGHGEVALVPAELAPRSPPGQGFVEARGGGEIWVGGDGALEEIRCDGEVTVGRGHLVALDASLGVTPVTAEVGAPQDTVALTGTGRVVLQSRSTGALSRWLLPLLEPGATNAR